MSAPEPLTSTSKQAACLNCRKSKIKCRREPGAATCEKCQLGRTECIVPTYHVGRQKGVKNKRTGLSKAIYQIEEAIKKSESNPGSTSASTSELYRLLQDARQSSLNVSPGGHSRHSSSSSPNQEGAGPSNTGDDQLSLDDAENPLQLLARASDLRLAASPQYSESTIPTPPRPAAVTFESSSVTESQRFFLPMRATSDGRDLKSSQGNQTDPIDIGLVTVEEAEHLVLYFYENLAHTRWGLDPNVHSLAFMRSQSAFLLTSILACSALFIPSAGALAKRLSIHLKTLAQQVITKRLRSVEIVLAFMANIPWMPAGAHSTDDDTGLYLGNALSIALDLSLNKIVAPSVVYSRDELRKLGKAECIDANKALAMDGFSDTDPNSERGQRLLRRRERAWIALFVLERGVCLARGRSYSVPITPLVKHCDRWPAAGIADVGDGPMVSMTVLRRDLDQLFSFVRSRCDNHAMGDTGQKVAREINSSIETFFDQWLGVWTKAIGEAEKRGLPPYVEILMTHTRLSAYSSVINHPTAPTEVKRIFRSSALSSSLNVLRAAIQGEARLQSMPNNTATMIAFAAAVAMNLSSCPKRGRVSFAPSVVQLVEETAAVLDRIGRVTEHRNGASVHYAEYLREILQQAQPTLSIGEMSTDNTQMQLHQSGGQAFTQNPTVPAVGKSQHPSEVGSWGQQFQFSAMSDDQINEMISNAGHNFDTLYPDFTNMDSGSYGDWDWMNPTNFSFQGF